MSPQGMLRLGLLVGTLAVIAPAAAQQDYTLRRSLVVGGGALSSGGEYRLRSTAGAAIAGSSTANGQQLTGGFWHPAGARPARIFRDGFE